jgi:hypothetical protein
MKRDVVVFWLERHLRQIEPEEVDHVALAKAGASYSARRTADEKATKQAQERKVELAAFRTAVKYVKAHAPAEIEDESE